MQYIGRGTKDWFKHRKLRDWLQTYIYDENAVKIIKCAPLRQQKVAGCIMSGVVTKYIKQNVTTETTAFDNSLTILICCFYLKPLFDGVTRSLQNVSKNIENTVGQLYCMTFFETSVFPWLHLPLISVFFLFFILIGRWS